MNRISLILSCLLMICSMAFAQIDYQRSDKKPYKEIHLFMMNNRIFVTGIYKEIDSLTVDHIRFLKKKNKYIEYDIYIAKKFQRGDLPIVDNDSCELKSRLRMDGYISINEYMIDHLNKRTFDGFETSVVFFIEDDGTLVCPIVVKDKNIEENKEVIRVLRKTMSGWLPAQKEGKNVLTMHGYSFDYVVRTVKSFYPKIRW